ncbi:MAG TPA: hypothetical protein VI953_00635 [Candidatus Paceibacterota bacterium]
MATLTQPALDLLKAYEGTPYFNNSRERMRMGLRAQVGKGTPEEIAEEAQLAAFREHVDLAVLTPEMHKKFLVDHKLGIDCSGFAYHILDTESRARGLGPLHKHLKFPYSASLLSSFGRSLRRRYVENTDAKTFAHIANSHEIPVAEIKPADFFVRLRNQKDPESERDHIFIVTTVIQEFGTPVTITVAQSRALPEEGRYNNGVCVENLPREALVKWGFPLYRLNWF